MKLGLTAIELIFTCFSNLFNFYNSPKQIKTMKPVSQNISDSVSVSYFLCVSLSAYSQSLKKVGKDSTVLLICITVFLSYLPEAGQYSSFFLYLRQVGNGCLVALEHEEIKDQDLSKGILRKTVQRKKCVDLLLAIV